MTLLLTLLAEIVEFLPLENSFAKVQVGFILAKLMRSFDFCPKVYLESSRTSKRERFAKIVNDRKRPLCLFNFEYSRCGTY